jgi:RNA polymerase sigma factor (sigma-70 family)
VPTAAASSAPPREEELVAAAQAGNREAFEALFRRYRQAITGYVRARVRDEGRAEDIVQETFFSAHNSLATLSHPRAFRAWLYQIAHNACLDEARRRSRNDELILGWDEFPPPDERIIIHHQSPDHQLSQKEELADLTQALGGLPPSQHEALVLRELEGMSYDEIGRRMQLSPGAVESVLFRARRGLKRAYSRAAAFLPLPAFFGRRAGSGEQPSGPSSFAAQAQGTAAQLTAVSGDHAVSLAQKAAAVVAAVAVVGGGTAAIEQAGVKIPVLDSIMAKKDHGKSQVTAGPAAGHNRAPAQGGSVPPGGAHLPKTAAGGGGSSPAGAPAGLNVPSSAVGSPGAPATTAPGGTAPGTSSPGNSSPGTSSPPKSGTPPSSGSNAPQTNQPNSTQGAKSPAKSQQLTTPTGEPIPSVLPPGIQRQLESGRRTLDDLPPGLQRRLADGSTSAATTAP